MGPLRWIKMIYKKNEGPKIGQIGRQKNGGCPKTGQTD